MLQAAAGGIDHLRRWFRILTEVSPEHLGLAIMKERAAAIRATLQVKSKPGCGTRLEVVWSGPAPTEAQ